MKKTWLLTLALCMASGAATAQQWEAKCTDGKNLHYLQTLGGEGYLYMTVSLPNNEKRVFPFARMRQTMFNGEAICGEATNGLRTRTNKPVTQYCVNRVSKIIYMKYQDPLEQQPLASGKFCDATVLQR